MLLIEKGCSLNGTGTKGKILNPKHQILNKFKNQRSKIKMTNQNAKIEQTQISKSK
jgi:hypothetical protein